MPTEPFAEMAQYGRTIIRGRAQSQGREQRYTYDKLSFLNSTDDSSTQHGHVCEIGKKKGPGEHDRRPISRERIRPTNIHLAQSRYHRGARSCTYGTPLLTHDSPPPSELRGGICAPAARTACAGSPMPRCPICARGAPAERGMPRAVVPCEDRPLQRTPPQRGRHVRRGADQAASYPRPICRRTRHSGRTRTAAPDCRGRCGTGAGRARDARADAAARAAADCGYCAQARGRARGAPGACKWPAAARKAPAAGTVRSRAAGASAPCSSPARDQQGRRAPAARGSRTAAPSSHTPARKRLRMQRASARRPGAGGQKRKQKRKRERERDEYRGHSDAIPCVRPAKEAAGTAKRRRGWGVGVHQPIGHPLIRFVDSFRTLLLPHAHTHVPGRGQLRARINIALAGRLRGVIGDVIACQALRPGAPHLSRTRAAAGQGRSRSRSARLCTNARDGPSGAMRQTRCRNAGAWCGGGAQLHPARRRARRGAGGGKRKGP